MKNRSKMSVILLCISMSLMSLACGSDKPGSDPAAYGPGITIPETGSSEEAETEEAETEETETESEEETVYSDADIKSMWDGWTVNGEEPSCTLDNGMEYRMIVTDAGFGNRQYVLLASDDGGRTIEMINSDPLNSTGGVAFYLTMFDDGTGYISQVWNDGDDGCLYRTENNGGHFDEVSLPVPEEKNEDGELCNPFTIAEQPEKDGDNLTLTVRQSDYAPEYKDGKVTGKFTSSDNGVTWTYAGEEPVK